MLRKQRWNVLVDHYGGIMYGMWGHWTLRMGANLYLIGNLRPPLSLSPILELIFLSLPKGCWLVCRPVASPSQSNWEDSHVPRHHMTNEPARCAVKPGRTRPTFCWYVLHYMKHEWSYSRQFQGNSQASYWTLSPTNWPPSSIHRIAYHHEHLWIVHSYTETGFLLVLLL